MALSYSIITVNLNNSEGLEKTFRSVADQKLGNLEYIVIDGGSSDGSTEIIETNSELIDYWISEKDSGVYNAMNKGIKAAKGDYVLFLNSGDYFYNNNSLNCLIEGGQQRDIIYGNLVVSSGTEMRIKRYPPVISFDYFLDDTLPHPATLIKRELLLSNPYNEQNRIVSDWEFFLNAICRLNASYQYVDAEISIFNLNGISSDRSNQFVIDFEKKTFLAKHYRAFIDDYRELRGLRNEKKRKSFLLKPGRLMRKITDGLFG